MDNNRTITYVSDSTSGNYSDYLWTTSRASEVPTPTDTAIENSGGAMETKIKFGHKKKNRSPSHSRIGLKTNSTAPRNLHQNPRKTHRHQQQLSLFLLQPRTGSKLSSMALYPPYRRSQADHPPQSGRKDIRSCFCSRNTCHLQLLPLVQVHHRNDSSHLA